MNKYIRTAKDDLNPQQIRELTAKILSELRGKPPFTHGGETVLDELEGATTEDEFNDAWEQVYDFADRNSVWLGF